MHRSGFVQVLLAVHLCHVYLTLLHPLTLLFTLFSALTDLDDNSSGFGPDTPPLKLDHCDLLLDAIDAQLGQLQVCGFYSVCLCLSVSIFTQLLHLSTILRYYYLHFMPLSISTPLHLFDNLCCCVDFDY